MQKGRVIKSTGSWYTVELADGAIISCRVRGKLRIKGIRTTNPVAVGDFVKIDGEEGAFTIVEIDQRKNYIVRRSVNLSKQSHIIASNLDLAIIVITLKNPTTYPTFIDRFCTAAEAYHIPVAVVISKADLLDEEELEVARNFLDVYADLGYDTLISSAENGKGIEEFKDLIQNKTVMLSGHSGVGKSRLVNAIDPDLQVKVGHISDFHQMGKHTTTFAEMHRHRHGGYIVDTPGIRGFGLVHFEKDELAGYFPEMRRLLPDCKFYNCIHVSEPGCAVKKALETGEVAQTRYNSYLNMLEENAEQSYRS
ncbi:MAG: ribosome small subunit-dependent GTPase A [Flavobacteriales bacterium]|nr:ribosome small subunit-dependent GTPase A [Flavobacteriales bacterium]